MITIRMVKKSGKYIGCSFSDRWNLRVLRDDYMIDPNLLNFKRFRASIRLLGFKCVSMPAETPVNLARTDAEDVATREASLTTMLFVHKTA